MQPRYYARRVYLGELFFCRLHFKAQFEILPVSQSIICPAIVVCYRNWLTETSLNMVFQVPLVIGSTCKCSCYPLVLGL